MYKKLLAWILAATMMIGMAACGGAPAGTDTPAADPSAEAPAADAPATDAPAADPGSGDPVRIGAWEPLTGAMGSGGSQIQDGYEMAKSLRPSVLGRPVELVYADNKSDKVEAANSMTRLVEMEKVVAVLGCYSSGLTVAGAAITEAAEIPLLPLATSPLVTDGRKFITRTNYQDPVAGTVMAQYLHDELGLKKVGMIRDVTSDYSVGLANYFQKAFVEATGDEGSVVGADFSTGDTDFSAQLNAFKTAGVEGIFMPVNHSDAPLICIQAKEMGIEVPMSGGDSIEAPEVIEIGGNAVEGLLFCSHFAVTDDPTPKAKEFLDLYHQLYPDRDVSSNTVIGFENYNLLLDAMEAVGSTDAAAVNEWLHNVKGWEGVTGTINIDPATGNPLKSVPINKVQDGKFVYVATVDPK